MKKTSVQNLIINALLLVEAVLIVFFLLRMITKPREKDSGPIVPDQELTIAEQEEEAPLQPVVGNSKPVDVQPVEGIRITAPANALDKDREFKITPVNDKDWDSLEKQLSEVSDEQMVFCFDLDAGMEPDEHLPGEFSLSLDLEKLGIPPILYDRLTVWRQAGDQLFKYTSQVENGKLTFRSDQNCFMIFALPSLGAVIKTGAVALAVLVPAFWGYETWVKHEATGDMYKDFFTMNDDAVKHEIKDSYGDFTLYFRFKDTEFADRFDVYKESCEGFVRRGKELEEKAEAEYNRQVEEKYNEERAEWTTWQKIMGSAEAKKKARAAIDKAAILARYCEEDILLKRYAEGMQLPPSIRDLCEMLKTANRFLTDNQCLRPQTCNLEVDLIQTGPSGEYRRTATKLPYMVINYSRMLVGGRYIRAGRGESMLLTVTHELFHHRQKTHNWPARMDYRSEESTAAYLENAAALYYIGTGEIVTNTAQALATGKFEGGKDFDPAPRENYEYFGQNFGNNIEEPNPAYTYADLMEYIQHQKKEKIAVKGGTFMNKYFRATSHQSNYMRWFDIKDEKEFEKYVQGFCEENVKRIYDRQSITTVPNDLKVQTLSVSRTNPVAEAKTVKGELIMRGFDIKGSPKDGSYHAFLVPGKSCTAEEITFYSSSDKFVKDCNKGGLYFEADDFLHAGAYFKPHSSALPFSVVALYAPDAPVIKKVKKDYVRFVLPKADKDMVKKGYITGALVTFRNADGTEKYIRAGVNKFGKEVKWSIPGVGLGGFTLRVKWIRENEDGSVYESPASKPAGQGSVPKEKEPVTASANVGKEKKQKEEQKESANPSEPRRDNEGKLVVYEEITEIPWKAVSVSIQLPLEENLLEFEDCFVPNFFIWPPLAEGIPSFGLQSLNPKCEAKFVKAGEGYCLTCDQTLSGTRRKNYLEDGEYHLAVTIFFDEDLHPVKGSFDGTSNQTKILPSWNLKPDGRIMNLPDRSSPSTMTYSGTFSFRDDRNGMLETLNMKGHWQKRRPQGGAERDDVYYSKTMADVKAMNVGQVNLVLINK